MMIWIYLSKTLMKPIMLIPDLLPTPNSCNCQELGAYRLAKVNITNIKFPTCLNMLVLLEKDQSHVRFKHLQFLMLRKLKDKPQN